MRPEIIEGFSDPRPKRLGRRLIYLETPHLIREDERRVMAEDRVETTRRRAIPVASLDDDRASYIRVGEHRNVRGVKENLP